MFGGAYFSTTRLPDTEEVREGVGLTNTQARLDALYGDDHRFTLRRARERIAEQEAGQFGERLATLVSDLDDDAPDGDEAYPDRFVVKSGGRVRFVKTKDIEWAEATGDYVRLPPRKGASSPKDDERDGTGPRPEPVSPHPPFDRRQCRLPSGNADVWLEQYVAVLTDGTERKLSRTCRDAVDDFFDGAL